MSKNKTSMFRAGMCAVAMAMPMRQPPQHEQHWTDVPTAMHIGYASFGDETAPEDNLPRRRADRDVIRALHCAAPLICLRRGPLT